MSISLSEIITWRRHPDDEMRWRPSGPGLDSMKMRFPLWTAD